MNPYLVLIFKQLYFGNFLKLLPKQCIIVLISIIFFEASFVLLKQKCRLCNIIWARSILWPPDAKSWLIWKDPDAGKDWGQEEKGTTEDEMVGWHHQLNGMILGRLRELVMDREAWRAAFHGVAKSRTRLSDWTELNWILGTKKIPHIRDINVLYENLGKCNVDGHASFQYCLTY